MKYAGQEEEPGSGGKVGEEWRQRDRKEKENYLDVNQDEKRYTSKVLNNGVVMWTREDNV